MKLVTVLSLMVLFCLAALAQYSGPKPPQPDLPYLEHADNLIPTEATEAQQQKERRGTVYTVPGAASKARTPLAEPSFLFLSEKIKPDSLELYQLEVRSGNRRIVFPNNPRNAPKPFRLKVVRLDGNLYRLEVNERMGLENGTYSISPANSNHVFCFDVY